MRIAAIACLVSAPAFAASDEEQIVTSHQDFAVLWSGGRFDALTGYFTPDAVRVGAAGDVARSPGELRAAFEKLLTGPMAGASIKVERGTVRILANDLALWQGGIEITPAGGKPMKGYVVDVMKRVDGKWLILETHPKLFPSSPPPPAAPSGGPPFPLTAPPKAPREPDASESFDINAVLLEGPVSFTKGTDKPVPGELTLHPNRLVFIPTSGMKPTEILLRNTASADLSGGKVVVKMMTGGTYTIQATDHPVWRQKITEAIEELRR